MKKYDKILKNWVYINYYLGDFSMEDCINTCDEGRVKKAKRMKVFISFAAGINKPFARMGCKHNDVRCRTWCNVYRLDFFQIG